MQKSVEVNGFPVRLLYSNPVCILTTEGGHGTEEYWRNAMVVSWLSPVNASKSFLMSINQKRHTAGALRKDAGEGTKRFVLNIPVNGEQETLLQLGGCTGKDVDKFKRFNLPAISPGHWSDDSPEDDKGLKKSEKDEAWGVALDSCVAHLMCEIISEQTTEVSGHHIFVCEILRAFVRKAYWDGKRFAPVDENSPPTLSFLGSKSFAATVPQKHLGIPDQYDNSEDESCGLAINE